MQTEIGGYLNYEQNYGKEFYKNYITLNSSRNCLQFLIREKNIKEIYIPYYLCLVIEETCKNENIKIKYYHIDENFMPIINNIPTKKNTYIYIVNYFGLIKKHQVKNLKKKYNNIILDNTHDFFTHNYKNIDVIYNCRKYFGVPDGAYLKTTIKIDEGAYLKAHSLNRIKHLFGRYEQSAQKFYEDFNKADKSFDNKNVELMSDITHNMLKSLNYKKIYKIRIRNFNYLKKYFSSQNKIKLKKNSNFMYPLLINNGSELRKYLINKKIYIPHLWPNIDKFSLNAFEKDLFNNLVLIPIDQRYNIITMKKIINIIINFEKSDKL